MPSIPEKARDLFLHAVGKLPTEQWDDYVAAACSGDAELEQQVRRYLQVHREAGSFLESPAFGVVTVDDPITERPGTVIGPYKLLEQIGEGGFGVVFMAEQQQPIRRKVALKVLKPGMDTRHVIARFEVERQALALMDHPNIAKVLDGGQTNSGRPYFVMDLVKGVPITEYCDQSQLTPRQRLELFLSVCQAIQHAHQKGIIHRDIKPSNVLVTMQDGAPLVKVIDFGIAKTLGQQLTDKTLFTGFAQMIGTPLYMSPEQAAVSNVDVDTRSDIYSLGVLLYELLTGTTPFDSARFKDVGYDEIRRIIREEEPPKPSTRISTLGQAATTASTKRKSDPKQLSRLFKGELDWIVMKALEKDRNRRYETANAFALDVQRYLADEPVQACPPSAWYRFRKFTRRNRRVLAVAGLILGCIGVLGGGGLWMVRDRAAREERLTTQVELFLDDMDRLKREQKWPEALAATRRAEAALAGGEAGEALKQRVRDARRDLAFVAELDRIRQERAPTVYGGWSPVTASRGYALAFRDYGVDVEALPAEEAVARLQAKAALAVPVAAALEDWAFARKSLGEDAPSWKPLLVIARRLDRDPNRDQFRAWWGRPVTPALQADLLRLAESIDVTTQRPTTLSSLALMLNGAKLPDASLRILQAGQYAHPADFWLNLALGIRLFDRKDYAGAIRYWTAAVSLRPDSAAAHASLGGALAGQGKLDEAVAECRKAIFLYPEYAPAHVNLGYALRRQKKLEEAFAEYRKAIKFAPKWAGAHAKLAVALFDEGKLDEAIACYERAIKLDPMDPEAHNSLGVALQRKGKLGEAITYYQQAIKLDPNYVEAHDNLGRVLFRQKKWDEAGAYHKKAIDLDPKYAPAHVNLGVVLYYKGKVDAAIACFKKAIKLDPKEAKAYSNLALVLREQGKLDEAFICFKKHVELNPNDAGAHADLGFFLCVHKHDYEGAIAEHRKAIELDPKIALVHMNLGVALSAKGDVAGAIAAYRKAIELDPKSALAHINLGRCLFDQKKWDEAIAAFGKAIDLDPKNAEVHINLGNAWWAKGDLEGATREFRAAIQIDPNDARIHDNLGHVLRDSGDLVGAVAACRRAIKLNPDYPNAHCNLGLALLRQGELRLALEELRRGHEIGSKNPSWRSPSSQWVRACERLVELDGKLPRYLEGKATPASPDEQIEVANLCLLKRLNAAAARFFEEAFTAKPELVEDLHASHCYNAACAAALAGCGQGKDANKVDEKERSRLRRQALDWLRADLNSWDRLLDKEPDKARPVVVNQMRHWQVDADLAGVRGAESLAKLPEAERPPWQKLWSDVANLLKQAKEKPPSEKKADTK
jgi:tetratricopeptide (TPR) repeat protein